jgi:hypothetical protein
MDQSQRDIKSLAPSQKVSNTTNQSRFDITSSASSQKVVVIFPRSSCRRILQDARMQRRRWGGKMSHKEEAAPSARPSRLAVVFVFLRYRHEEWPQGEKVRQQGGPRGRGGMPEQPGGLAGDVLLGAWQGDTSQMYL